ncbi:hypothetical protein AB0L71_28235 [Streptomyces sp. NPDC052052]|uniref:hypothetical protein n=1 Tax=Streptomyces sp. NPDC052052 TaxID=3154756 RepID=UPI00343B294A
MTAKPAAPASRRVCRRYNVDGSPCVNMTPRLDGWCGKCAGFTQPQPTVGVTGTRWFKASLNGQAWTPVSAPLDLDEAHNVAVTFAARKLFAARHSCSMDEAEVQIRSLLEDLLISGQIDQSEDGWYRLMFKKEGYLLLLSPDRAAVKMYQTKHVERTWAQVKEGVKSRVSMPKTAGHNLTKWIRGVLGSQDAPLHITQRALYTYATAYAETRLQRDNAKVILSQMERQIEQEIAPKIVHPLAEGVVSFVVDTQGWTWALVLDKGESMPVVLYLTCRNMAD